MRCYKVNCINNLLQHGLETKYISVNIPLLHQKADIKQINYHNNIICINIAVKTFGSCKTIYYVIDVIEMNVVAL